MDDANFPDLIAALRRGDSRAAAEFVARYEPEIRRVVRLRLVNPQMQQQFDSMDIYQSVLANFFTRFGAGQFDVESPERMLKLLITMSRNKLTDLARRQHSEKRDVRRQGADDAALDLVSARGETPSEEVMNAELLATVRQRLDADEIRLFEQRAAGQGWDELAAERSVGAEALRKRYSRAIDRVARDLGFANLADDE